MKRVNFVLAIMLFAVNCLFAQTWDVLEKSMASDTEGWTVAKGGNLVVTQQEGYVNITKASGQKWAWFKPAAAFTDLELNTPYSVEVKVRLNDISTDNPNNQISLRLKKNVLAPIFLSYGDGDTGGYVSIDANGSDKYALNTSEYQVYRIVLHADHAKYDVYVAGVEEPVFKNVSKGNKTDDNGVYFGSESNLACNMDIEYVKMGKGNFFSKPDIASVSLSHYTHIAGNEQTVAVTANAAFIDDGAKLYVSLVNKESGEELVEAVEATVNTNVATADLVLPASLAEGIYAVKVAAENDKLGEWDLAPKTVVYQVRNAERAKWNVIDRNFTEIAWNEGLAWTLSNNKVSADFITQREDGVNLLKTKAVGREYWAFLLSPEVSLEAGSAYTYQVKARVKEIDKTEFPDTPKPDDQHLDDEGGYEANQLAFQLNNQLMSVYLIYGTDASAGYMASQAAEGTGFGPSTEERHGLNTSEWHVYSLVYDAEGAGYDVYVDGNLVFSDVALGKKTGPNTAKLGGESWQRINLDIEYVKLGAGDLMSKETTGIENTAMAAPFALSRTVLNAGESLAVMANGDLQLSEAVFYSLTGKEVSRTAVGARMVELQAPSASGMYILRVMLSDSTTKEFKVLVK